MVLAKLKNVRVSGGSQLFDYPLVSRSTIHGRAAALFGLPFFAAGLAIVLVALDVIAVDESTIHAPRWVLGVAGGVFFVAGAGISLHGIVGLVRLARLDAKRASHPEEPWLADYAWNPVGIRSREGSSIWQHVFGATITFGLTAMMNWAAFMGGGGWVFGVVACSFDLVIGYILYRLLRGALARVKYGTPCVEFATFPARPGRTLRLRVHCEHDVGEAQALFATLRFVEEQYVTTGSGKNRTETVQSYEYHKDQQQLDGFEARKLATSGLELEFNVPSDARSTKLRGRPASYWELEILAEQPGVDFHHRFLLPIYAS